MYQEQQSSAGLLPAGLPTIIAGWGVTNRQTTNLLTIPNAVIYIIVSICFGLYLDRQTRFPKPLFMIIAQVASIGGWHRSRRVPAISVTTDSQASSSA